MSFEMLRVFFKSESIEFWNAKRLCDQFCAKSKPQGNFLKAKLLAEFLTKLWKNFRFSKNVLKKCKINCLLYLVTWKKSMPNFIEVDEMSFPEIYVKA